MRIRNTRPGMLRELKSQFYMTRGVGCGGEGGVLLKLLLVSHETFRSGAVVQ